MADFEEPEGRPTSQRCSRRKNVRPIHREWDRHNWRGVVEEPESPEAKAEPEQDAPTALVPAEATPAWPTQMQAMMAGLFR